jgi:nitroreductase
MKFAELATRKEDLIFYGAPLLIMICTSPADEWAKADVGLAAENMFIAARSLGLGSCYVGLANSLNKDRKLLASLGIPEDHEIIAPLIFGYPKGDFPAAPKREAKVLKRIE